MFEFVPVNDHATLAIKVGGKLTDADYRRFTDEVDKRLREVACLSLFIELDDFAGWEAAAAWDDVRFGLQHDRDFKRIAIVGATPLEHAGTALANFFSHIDIRFFPKAQARAAWDWLEEIAPGGQPAGPAVPYRRLLLATDCSPAAEAAARRALDLAQHYDAELHVLFVVEEIGSALSWYVPASADVELPTEPLMRQARDSLEKFAERTGLVGSAALNVEWGYTKSAIPAWARANDIDLIIMGSRGRHGWGRVLGSVSSSVAARADCEVLIVHA